MLFSICSPHVICCVCVIFIVESKKLDNLPLSNVKPVNFKHIILMQFYHNINRIYHSSIEKSLSYTINIAFENYCEKNFKRQTLGEIHTTGKVGYFIKMLCRMCTFTMQIFLTINQTTTMIRKIGTTTNETDWKILSSKLALAPTNFKISASVWHTKWSKNQKKKFFSSSLEFKVKFAHHEKV